MARTPLFGRIRSLIRAAQAERRTGIAATEIIAMPRRRFMQAAGGVLAATAFGAAGCASTPEIGRGKVGRRVAVIGGGIAGLNCAYQLKKKGVYAEVFEASDRTGGRIFSKEGLLNPGQVVEVGAEFIDTPHEEMFALCKEFGLEMADMASDPMKHECAYFFGGKHYTDREVLDALQPFVARMEKDAAWLEADWEALASDKVVRDLDNTSLSAYLGSIGITGWLKALLEVAFVTEYGGDADAQSCFNMLCLIGLDTSTDRWETFGESDERYKVIGGNQRVVDELAGRVKDRVFTGHRLMRVRRKLAEYELAFDSGGGTKEAIFDHVVLALPFTLLREVELEVDLPAEKTNAIRNLGYGTNAKVMLGTSSRPWRAQGNAGGIFSDLPFQLAWDNARTQKGEGGGITLYSGGKPGVEVGNGTPREQVERMLPGIDKAFPGTEASWNKKLFRMHWPSHAFTKASYACYRPGQWTTIHGHEGTSVENLHFAGEHCSTDWQGYMEGGAATGHAAATAIVEVLQG